MDKHVGGSYVGNDESEAQTQFALMCAGAALAGVVKQERAQREAEMAREQNNLIRWRLIQKIKGVKRK